MTPTLRKAIAALEIMGGLAGVYVLARTLFGSAGEPVQGPLAFAVAVTFLILYLGSLLAGWMLWQSTTKGRGLSLVIQALQVPWFTLLGWRYRFATGLYAIAGVESGRGDFQAGFGSDCSLWIFSEPVESAFFVNLVALVLFVVLLRARD